VGAHQYVYGIDLEKSGLLDDLINMSANFTADAPGSVEALGSQCDSDSFAQGQTIHLESSQSSIR
jgi:hypothetical protein